MIWLHGAHMLDRSHTFCTFLPEPTCKPCCLSIPEVIRHSTWAERMGSWSSQNEKGPKCTKGTRSFWFKRPTNSILLFLHHLRRPSSDTPVAALAPAVRFLGRPSLLHRCDSRTSSALSYVPWVHTTLPYLNAEVIPFIGESKHSRNSISGRLVQQTSSSH